jgi:glycerophosphoryl diester phosphodiesterase
VPETVRLQLEVKAHADPALAHRTAEALCEWLCGEPIRERVELISFHAEACAVAAANGISSRLVIWADYAPEALASWALRTGVDGISVEHFLLTERLVQVLRDAGLSLNTGTVNHSELLSRVLEFAPDAIGTDRPHELRAGAETPLGVGAQQLVREASRAGSRSACLPPPLIAGSRRQCEISRLSQSDPSAASQAVTSNRA